MTVDERFERYEIIENRDEENDQRETVKYEQPNGYREQMQHREAQRNDIRNRVRNHRQYEDVEYRPASPDPKINDEDEKNVAVYARVSTNSLEQVSSIENQTKFYTEKVENTPNWTLTKIYSDEGKSGTSMRGRTAFKEMINDAEKGKFDMIICASVSRFARNISDCIRLISKLRTANPDHPVGVYFETENLFTLDKNANQTLDFYAMLADWESRNKSQRMILSYDQRISMQQYPVSDLLGYRHTRDGDLLIVPEEAKTVRFIYLSYITGTDLNTIAETLTEKQRPTLHGRTDWNSGMVRNIMQNERRWGDLEARKYIVIDYKEGKVVRNRPNSRGGYNRSGAYVRNHHKGIVSKDIARAAQYISKSGNSVTYVPEIHVINEGSLKGFVMISPEWAGIDAELFTIACRSVYDHDELELLDYESRLQSGEEDSNIRSFSFAGYQVPYGVYLIQSNSPSITLSRKGIAFSETCRKRLDHCRYIEILYHPIFQTIVIRPCSEDHPNRIAWKTEKGAGRNLTVSIPFCERMFSNLETLS